MIVAVNRTQGRASDSGGMFSPRFAYQFDTPEALDVLRRIDAATDEAFEGRDQHIEQIALVCLRAKRLA